MENEAEVGAVLSRLPWPEGGGNRRYGYTPETARYLKSELIHSLDAAGFKAVAASWRSADQAAVVRVWSEDCGRWNLWVNGHESIYDSFAHEPTARLLDGLQVGRRCAAALGLVAPLEPADVDAFVAAWHHVANHEVPDPVTFGPLLTDPPDEWAVGLAIASLLIVDDGDAVPTALEPLLRAVQEWIER